MTSINFHPVEDPGPDNPDYDDTGCQCPPGDNQYLLEIEEGQATLVHATCGKTPSYTWGDFQELVVMDPIPVTVNWESDCDGSPWHGLNPCDCDHWVQITATSVPEDIRTSALELSRKHAADRAAQVANEARP
ncbi:hypothetical protein OOK48_35395 [Streptomyces viridodiastaticus]|uniref:hypothetical protein n=1 Tax=Streptomyces albogriseolus TaxID=1887 RepID=UPI00224DD385|nr:hypothetical protein [Streptomyces viridodiastaticus]MCX4571608.1 hypothetical protein [Streptomyces viridodiastaticus]